MCNRFVTARVILRHIAVSQNKQSLTDWFKLYSVKQTSLIIQKQTTGLL